LKGLGLLFFLGLYVLHQNQKHLDHI